MWIVSIDDWPVPFSFKGRFVADDFEVELLGELRLVADGFAKVVGRPTSPDHRWPDRGAHTVGRLAGVVIGTSPFMENLSQCEAHLWLDYHPHFDPGTPIEATCTLPHDFRMEIDALPDEAESGTELHVE